MIDEETDYRGHDIGKGVKVKNQQACATMTATKEGGLFWTYRASDKKCWIKTSKKGKMAQAGLVSGNIECGKKMKNASVLQDLMKTCPKFSCHLSSVMPGQHMNLNGMQPVCPQVV